MVAKLSNHSLLQLPPSTTPMAGSASVTIFVPPALFADVLYHDLYTPMRENPSSMTASQGIATRGSTNDHVFYPFSTPMSSNKQFVLRTETAATKSQDMFYPFGMGSGATRSVMEDMFYQLLELGAGGTRRGRKSRKGDEEEIFYPFSKTLGMGLADRGWKAKEDEKGLHLCVEMPGLGKEHVTISVEHSHILVIHGGNKQEPVGQSSSTSPTGIGSGSRRRLNYKFHFPNEVFKMDNVKGEMKNGLLHLTIPKLQK